MKKVVKIRTLSAIILLAILIPIIFIGKIPFALVVGLASILAVKELNDLYKFPLIIKLLSFISMITLVYSNFDANTIFLGLNYKVLNIIILMLTIPIIFYQVKNKYNIEDAFKLIGFILLIGLGLNYFILIRNYDLKYFFLMAFIPWITDTFAFIGGSMVGKHKASKISPNKSWEGYIIGSLMGTFIVTVYYTTLINAQTNLLIVIGSIFLMTVVAQIGDLFFSAIKRHYNIKDFSNLIPEHGGILDRLDSLIFVSIIFMIFIDWL